MRLDREHAWKPSTTHGSPPFQGFPDPSSSSLTSRHPPATPSNPSPSSHPIKNISVPKKATRGKYNTTLSNSQKKTLSRGAAA